MEQAWLDSLSEDWVSQPRSSGSPAPSLPSLTENTSESSDARAKASRIPKYDPQKKSWTAGSDNALIERSPNDYNIPLSQRGSKPPSKLRSELSGSDRGAHLPRNASTSTTHSTQYHTIEHKSVNKSPRKGLSETPEWRKRLLHGDVAYGEQRDLFSPAGLENMFRPPQSQPSSNLRAQAQAFEEESIVMPSSPPPYNLNRRAQEEETDLRQRGEEEAEERKQPRVVKYNMVDDGVSEFSANDLSRSSSFQPRAATTQSNPGHGKGAPISIQEGLLDGAGRAVSGQSDIRNEELSPILVSRQSTVDGNVDYTANLPAVELKQRLEDIREGSPLQTSEGVDESSRLVLEGMTADTDDFAHNGRFINVRRGGRSQEGSFQKRMLSPSSLPAIDESGMLPEESMQASTPKQLPNIRKTRTSNEYQNASDEGLSPVPQTPHTSPSKSHGKRTETSSGSPLKLFGTYDTFTSKKLLRRLSQFEEEYEPSREDNMAPSASGQEPTKSELNEGFVAASSPTKVPPQSRSYRNTSRKINSFGEGELDDFQFSEDVSYDSSRSNVQDEDKENTSLPVLDPKSQTRFKFQLDPSPALDEDVVTERRARYTNSIRTTKRTTSIRKTIRPVTGSSENELPPSQRLEDLETPRKRNGDSEGKRLPKSPLKDPTPKRRRTLQRDDISELEVGDDTAGLGSLRDTHHQMQSVVGKKRKDARHGDSQQAANPKVLAMRQILRPRTPTPSQRSSQQNDRPPLLELDIYDLEKERLLLEQETKIAQIQAELDMTNPFKVSAILGASQHLRDESRKGSVTTQDFLDEAKKIMAGIRGKVRPQSGLTSLEESEAENERNHSAEEGVEGDILEDSYQESTKEPFSRPPSRDGKPVTRMPLMQEDPALLDHLRKYQEKSDMDDAIASSIRTLAMAKEVVEEVQEIERATNETISRASGKFLDKENFIESEPPNIRISTNPEAQRKRKHSTSSIPTASDVSREAGFLSHGSTASSNQSTSRSIPTGSSRGSDSRRVIAPHSVAHLIPEQLAGMVFDQEKNIWIKRKSVSAESGGQGFLSSDETEEDPFGDIPDLSVDETQERQRIKAVAAKHKAQLSGQNQRGLITPASQRRPSSYHGPTPEAFSQASLSPSKLSRFAPGPTVTGINLESTSAESKHAPTTISQMDHQNTPAHHKSTSKVETKTEVFEEVEKEISIHEDRVPRSPQRRRNVTISFSSPLASIIDPPDYNNRDSFEHSADEAEFSNYSENWELQDDRVRVTKRHSSSKEITTKAHTANRKSSRGSSRGASLGRHTFSGRPVSRIDERDEESSGAENEDVHQRSISVIVTTPAPKRATSMALVTPRPSHDIGTLELTPLSDFTIHHEDRSFGLNVSFIAAGQRFTHGSNQQKTLSVSIKALVERITEVEPYEPYWEDLKQIDLKEKALTTLHKLDEFCRGIQELDASHNQISQLNGVPDSVRHLRMTHNRLSTLTAWNHLHNLQYIDISNNEVESLSGFKNLVHLRSLRADNNRIVSLDGVTQLDGLLSLRLRGNLLESVDFSRARLPRLTDLDLRNNRINNVQNIDQLLSLSDLNLEDNELSEFSPVGRDEMLNLKYLRLSGNELTSIDLGPYPSLRLAYLDRNRLSNVNGIFKTKRLDSLSLREQQEGTSIDMSFLSQAFEIRKLFLSGNLLRKFEPDAIFLNLQYLELANCGLESLPTNFGQMFPNARVLNLNFNALKSIKPLLGIQRLKRLHLAGNRLAKVRQTTSVLSQSPFLTTADLRGNPLTVGFYPPLLDTSQAVRKACDGGDVVEPFTIGNVDSARDAKYAGRLDMETKTMRRVYELLMMGGCPRLRILDGLDVKRSMLELRDEIWNTLVESGVLAESPCGKTSTERIGEGTTVGEQAEDSLPSKSQVEEEERWQAEDSFA